MGSVARPSHPGTSAAPPRKASRRTVLLGGTALVVLGALAVSEYGVSRSSSGEDAALAREDADPRASSLAQASVHAPAPRPALPQIKPVEPSPVEPSLLDSITGEDKRTRTHIKVDRYVDEAYPAWLRAHPGKECPRQLGELSPYIGEGDANDAWGRPLTWICGAAQFAGKKRIEVMSLGRDAEARTEDDIIAED